MPDMAIADELVGLMPGLAIEFVSYAAGAEVYRAHGRAVHDLRAVDMPPFLDITVKLTRLIGFMDRQPQLIVAHEEYPALVAAQIVGIPCVFITDFFLDPNTMAMDALKFAAEVIFVGERGMFTEPPFLSGKIQYVGRPVRRFNYSCKDRGRARQELGISEESLVVLIQPGAWDEARVPIAQLMMDAWKRITVVPKRLIWLAGRDVDALASQFADERDVLFLREDWQIDRLMAASNVLITKANRVTVFEAAAMGLSSVSISTMANWPDDVAVSNVKSNVCLSADGLTSETLSGVVEKATTMNVPPAVSASQGVAAAASLLAAHLRAIQ